MHVQAGSAAAAPADSAVGARPGSGAAGVLSDQCTNPALLWLNIRVGNMLLCGKSKVQQLGFSGARGSGVCGGRPAGSGEGKRHAHHERSLVRMRTPRFYCGTVLQAISHCQSSTRGPSHEVLLRRKVQSRPNRPGLSLVWFCQLANCLFHLLGN